MTTRRKRNPVDALHSSLQNARDFYEKLCEINKKIIDASNDNEVLFGYDNGEWRTLAITHRALWISLIVEVGRIFDTFYKPGKEVISFKQTDFFKQRGIKEKVDVLHGEKIISKLIHTRDTFTAHISQNWEEICPVSDVCTSNLPAILDKLDEVHTVFTLWWQKTRGWESL